MAVSKVAIMALVGILAVPILLGYALNLEEVAETDYKLDGEAVNVTPLLQNGIYSTYANADVYQLNTNFRQYGDMYPIFNTITTTNTSLPMGYTYYTAGSYPNFNDSLANWSYLYYQSNNSTTGGYVTLHYASSGGSDIQTISRLHTFLYDAETSKIDYSYYTSNGLLSMNVGHITVSDTSNRIYLTADPTYAADGYFISTNAATNTFVDFAGGFYFAAQPNSYYIDLPKFTKNVLFTINLDSITDSDYTINFGYQSRYTLQKTTSGSDVTWVWHKYNDPSDSTTLYYDNTRTDNTYQVYIDLKETGISPGYTNYNMHVEFRYVGGWPTLMGESNYYQKYTRDDPFSLSSSASELSLEFIRFWNLDNDLSRSPTLRFDAGSFSAFGYNIIKNKEYTPADFKTNPSTKITDVSMYGDSITFAGTTYAVGSDGNIMLGTHKASINGMVFDSVPVAVGYENRINGTVVNVSADPATITFDGQWMASVSTTAQTATTYTKTEWIAGDFAWDGLDTNFLLVGLITSLGMFIALGIYSRRSSTSMWPLMIVCGCAAALFFIMI